jgi:hypothetical protein
MKILAFILLSFSTFAQIPLPSLSTDAEISIITCGPGEELFTSYGHTALRIIDRNLGLDRVYNYGTFDFNTPYFYAKFTVGKLNYMLKAGSFDRFLYEYQREGRWVKEQILDIPIEKKQAIFEFVEWNTLPENSYYRYDFFFDNCATRVRDLLENILGDGLSYDSASMRDASFRDMIREYQAEFLWSDFGIDIALGSVIDRKMNFREFMFLPDFIYSSFESATFKGSPLMKIQHTINPQTQLFDHSVFPSPGLVIGMLFLITLAVSLWDLKRGKSSRWYDVSLFTIIGLLGALIVFLWFFTEHTTTIKNYNIFWAIPLHLPIAVLLAFSSKKRQWVKSYFLAATLLTSMALVAGLFIKQSFHPLFYPIMLVLIMRCWVNYFQLNKSLPEQSKVS